MVSEFPRELGIFCDTQVILSRHAGAVVEELVEES
jgi:hypothetical protein